MIHDYEANTDSSQEESQARRFGERLEDLAERVTAESRKGKWNPSPAAMIDREVALTLDHLNRVDDLKKSQETSLLRTETYIDTELMQMEQRTSKYSSDRFPEREKLHRRLHSLGDERRRHAAIHEDKRQVLENKLLFLMNRRTQLVR